MRCGAFALVALNVTGCRTSSDDNGNDALVRLINASPRAQDLAVAVDGKRVWHHSLFRSNTGYASVAAGSYKVAVEARQGGRLVSGSSFLTCDKGRAYTVLTLGRSGDGAPDVRIFGEDRDAPVPAGRVRVRFVNAIAGGNGEADLLFNNIAGLPSVAYGSRSGAILLEPGAYDVKVNAAEKCPLWQAQRVCAFKRDMPIPWSRWDRPTRPTRTKAFRWSRTRTTSRAMSKSAAVYRARFRYLPRSIQSVTRR